MDLFKRNLQPLFAPESGTPTGGHTGVTNTEDGITITVPGGGIGAYATIVGSLIVGTDEAADELPVDDDTGAESAGNDAGGVGE